MKSTRDSASTISPALPYRRSGFFCRARLTISASAGGTFGATVIAPAAGDEPCAYVHNRFYIKRLIFDSIDWMVHGAGGALTGSITIDATAYPNAALWFGAPAGTTGPFTATRP